MGGPGLFKKILYPTDLSEQSLKTLGYVVDLSKANRAELVLLHAYRLNNNSWDNDDIIQSKKALEVRSQQAFEKINEQYLRPSGLTCQCLSEVGFITDRIIANIKTHRIDLLILCEQMQDKMADPQEERYMELVRKLPCPVMLIPVTYP